MPTKLLRAFDWRTVVLLSLMIVLGPTLQRVHAQNFALQYNLNYSPIPFPGSSTTLINIFTNSGDVPERVTGVTITLDFGTFTMTSGLPLTVPVGQVVRANMTAQVPSTASVGTHTASASVAFQYQGPNASQWITPTASPLVVQGSIQIQANPSGTAALGFVIIGVIAALAVAVVILVVRMRRKPKPEALPPTAPMSTPSTPTTGP